MRPESKEKFDMNAVKEGQLDKVGQNYMFLVCFGFDKAGYLTEVYI